MKSSGLCAKEMSCVLKNSLAISGDDTMRVETSPNFRCIKGPYILAKSLRPWCGKEPPSWCKFPMIGNFHGPGGSFRELLCDFLNNFRDTNTNKNKLRKIGNMGNWRSIEKN